MQDTDYLNKLGPLALASRLRRLLQRLNADGERIYRDLGIDVKPKWFPVMRILSEQSPLALTDIARLMSLTHPSLIETVNELISVGLIDSRKSDLDGRRRELSLTDKGKRFCKKLVPVWEAFRLAGEEVNKDCGNDFLDALGKFEQSLERRPMYNRVMVQLGVGSGRKK